MDTPPPGCSAADSFLGHLGRDMNQIKRHSDPLGRSIASALRIVLALGVALSITGSARPSWAGSVGPRLDRIPWSNFLPASDVPA